VPEMKTPHAPTNRLLAALPTGEMKVLRPNLEEVSLAFKQLLYEANKPVECVYFLHRGVTSIVTDMEDGTTIEVATVGPEGMVGLSVFLDASVNAARAFAQVPGEAARMDARAFRRALDRTPRLRALLSRYTMGLLNQLAQNSACNRTHEVEQRLARWLLMTHDRVHAATFPMTQDFMAQMLGVSRPTVSNTASTLQKAGLISYVRGNMTVLDRLGLEAATCECYRVIRGQFDRLVGGDG
jgi:CRP-like cAMP-binding protein